MCSARYGDYLSDIGTEVVRDMDAIRAAVGDRKASFLGLSYGTRVGAVYAQTFPDRVRAMVLDGSLPPVSTATEISVGLATSFEGALNEYFQRCVRERPACVFGDDPAAGFDALVNELRANPITLSAAWVEPPPVGPALPAPAAGHVLPEPAAGSDSILGSVAAPLSVARARLRSRAWQTGRWRRSSTTGGPPSSASSASSWRTCTGRAARS